MELIELAEKYLDAKEKASTAAALAMELKAELEQRMRPGDTVETHSGVYFWSVVVSNAGIKWKDAFAYVYGKVTPDVRTVMDEAEGSFQGKRTTKELLPD